MPIFTHTDSAGDTVNFSKTTQSGRVYVSVNGLHQVRLLAAEVESLVEFLKPPAPVEDVLEDVGIFFLLRQKKSDPSKVKVCWAESTVSRMFTSRGRAEACAKRQNENYPDWKYFVVEKEDF